MFHQVPSDLSISTIKSASKASLAVLYKKCLIKFKKCNNHIWYNLECLKLNISPRYMKIKCNHKSVEAKKAVKEATKIWQNLEIKKWYFRRSNLSLHLKLIHTELLHLYSNIEFDLIDQEIRLEAQEKSHMQYVTQLKKLKKLKPASEITNTEQTVIFHERVKNLSNVSFNDNELNLLSKGLKYCPNIQQKNEFELLAVNTELALNCLDNVEIKQIEKVHCADIITRERKKQSNSNIRECITIKHIKQKLEQENLILSKADKGNTVTIMPKENYIEKTNDLLTDDKFTELKADPTNKFQTEIISTIKNSPNIFTKNDRYYLTNMNPIPPMLYGLPKIHKTNCPMRPVVSYVNAPAYKLCKRLNTSLPAIIDFNPKYAIKNSLELVNSIKNKNIPTNAKLISFDVVNLFPSVPIKELLNILTEHIHNCDLENINKQEILNALKICIKQSYFKFNNKIYIQKDGLPMGSPLSPLLSEIFMSYLENKIFSSNQILTKNVFYWARYVDDVFCIWTGSDRQLDSFLNFINSFYPSIKFTVEIEKSGSLNFLDLTLTKSTNKIIFDIYRKPTYSDTLPHSNSKQSKCIKLSAFHSFVHRLLTIPLNKENYDKEVITLKTIAKNNGYNENLIDNLISKKQKRFLLKNFYPVPNEKDKKQYHYINFTTNASDKICNRLRKCNFNPICVNKNNLGSLLVNNKLEKIEKSQKSGVYELGCNDCDAIYVGQSGRSIKKRYAEHKKSILNNNKCTGFADHCIENNHFPDFNKMKLLHTEKKGRRLDLLEALEISKARINNKIITNDQIDFGISPLIKAAIL